MEETTQQISQKPPFPIKTKIAAWWLIVVGVIMISVDGAAFFFVKFFRGSPDSMLEFAIFLLFFVGLIFLIPAWYLLKRKKWALTTLLITLFIIVILIAYVIFIGFVFNESHSIEQFLASNLPYFIPFLIPLILLLLDRKNFFKITS